MKIRKIKITAENGITLVALVITIVILIILATITVNFVFGENGLINRAQQGTEEYNKSDIRDRVTILQSEFLIDKAAGEEDDFANFLRKELQVGVTQDEEGNYNFAVDGWQVEATENEVISIERLNMNPDKIYPNVASMRADTELTDGQLVQTEGYWDKQYAGGAYYDIVSSTNLAVDDGKCIQLDNGLYAELHPINDTVTVNQFGAYGDGEHDDAGAIEKAVNSGFGSVSFESERYRQCSSIEFQTSNVFLLGNNSTIFNDQEYTPTTNYGFDWHLCIKGSSNNILENISIDNLNMDSVITTDLEEVQIGAWYVNNVNISNCELNINEIENQKDLRMTHIRFHTACEDVVVENCKLINLSKEDTGGIIWFSSTDYECMNASIKNCYMKKECYDESIAIWGDSITKIDIVNNTIIEDRSEKGNTMTMRIGFERGTVKDVNINENNFEIDGYASLVKIGGENVNNVENVSIDNNDINFNVIFDTISLTLFEGYTGLEMNNINISNNNIEVTSNIDYNSQEKKGYILANGNMNFYNNDISVTRLNLDGLSTNVFGNIENNNINSSETVTNLFVFNGNNNTSDISILNNNITIGNCESWGAFILLQNILIDNRKINISNNKIIAENVNSTRKFVSFYNVLDTEPKILYSYNNELDVFTDVSNVNNVVNHSVIFE